MAGIGATLATSGMSADEPAPVVAPPKTALEALARLKEGNARFVSGNVRHAHQASAWREHLKSTQQPFATILCCSDSRVPPELVFDQGFGDLFIVRVAGNVVAPDVIGSLQYAVFHLKTPLVLVMGHESCGAVTAAVEALDGKAEEPRFISRLLKAIEPGLKDLPKDLPAPERIHQAVEANVRWTMKELALIPESRQKLAEDPTRLQGAVYELDTGKVRFFN